jgi:anti-sigma factor RsiW
MMDSSAVRARTAMCNQLLSDLMLYIDGEITADLCAAIERHLAECADCRALVDTTRRTMLLAHELPQPVLSAEAKQRLLAALDLSGNWG